PLQSLQLGQQFVECRIGDQLGVLAVVGLARGAHLIGQFLPPGIQLSGVRCVLGLRGVGSLIAHRTHCLLSRRHRPAPTLPGSAAWPQVCAPLVPVWCDGPDVYQLARPRGPGGPAPLSARPAVARTPTTLTGPGPVSASPGSVSAGPWPV